MLLLWLFITVLDVFSISGRGTVATGRVNILSQPVTNASNLSVII